MTRRHFVAGLHGADEDPLDKLLAEETHDAEPKPSWGQERVYFFHIPALGRVKIGYTKSGIRQRLAAIQLGLGFPVFCVACLNGGRDLERLMFDRFEGHRIRRMGTGREWFADDILPEVREMMKAELEFYGPPPEAPPGSFASLLAA